MEMLNKIIFHSLFTKKNMNKQSNNNTSFQFSSNNLHKKTKPFTVV
uniref:Uncharacterized protein n=1 Tax=Anguilla anguilla TaxID=7936 RepID=A0A0E9QE92_ANGAN